MKNKIGSIFDRGHFFRILLDFLVHRLLIAILLGLQTLALFANEAWFFQIWGDLPDMFSRKRGRWHFFYIFDINKSSSYGGESLRKNRCWKTLARTSLSQTVLSEFSLLVTTFSTSVCSFFPVFAAVMELSDRQLEAKDDVSDFPRYLKSAYYWSCCFIWSD